MKNAKVLKIDELSYVSGGNFDETTKDSFELFDRGLLKERYNKNDIIFNWEESSAKVDEAWRKAGIDVITNPFGYNVYKKDGKEINRYDAMEHLKKNFPQAPLK